MGSLTSRPELPPVQPPVIVTLPPAPSPAPVATPVQTAGSATETAEGAGTGTEEAQRLAREDNLLRRGRGHLGTILTGFNGVLSDAIAPVRKTLLGE